MNKAEVPLMYDRVMAAAILKDDYIMITRLHEVPNKDLLDYDARYHRGENCLTNYTGTSDKKASGNTIKQMNTNNDNKKHDL